MSGDSVGDPLEVEHVLEMGEGSSHPEPVVNTGFPSVEEEAAALIIRFALDL